MKDVQATLELSGWTQVRGDEWRNGQQSLRFNYAHLEFRLFVRRVLEGKEEMHCIHVRPVNAAHIPTVREILNEILELRIPVGGNSK